MIGINPFEGLWANFSAGEQPEFRRLEELAPGYRKESWRRGLLKLGVDDEQLAGELAEQFAAERRSRPHQEKIAGVPELAPYFDEIVISGTYGKGKPDPTIFEHALSLLGLTPEQTLMVGDKQTTDIKGGNSAGLTTVWINRTGKVKDPSIEPDYEIKHLSELHRIIAERS
ncbi:hypothetical protein BGX30_008989 [Mortierella sp. GBA39]|nr:hypothetical protein BGX30_008989 [Mortierella sp. GBA39]